LYIAQETVVSHFISLFTWDFVLFVLKHTQLAIIFTVWWWCALWTKISFFCTFWCIKPTLFNFSSTYVLFQPVCIKTQTVWYEFVVQWNNTYSTKVIWFGIFQPCYLARHFTGPV